MIDPNVDQYIAHRAGEQKVLEVPKHWAACIAPVIRMLVGVALCAWSASLNGPFYWIVLFFGWLWVVEAFWRHLQIFRDRFVITTTRIFRCHGVISTKRPTIPIGRITDMTVAKPSIGQLLGYGHLRFESAGQNQDLERVKFVRDIDRVDEVQRIIATRKSLEHAYNDWTADQIQSVLEGT